MKVLFDYLFASTHCILEKVEAKFQRIVNKTTLLCYT